MKNNNKAIIFTHHENSDFEQQNSNIIKGYNPDWDFYPIGFEGYDLLPGSLVACREDYPNNTGLATITKECGDNPDWYSCDILLCEAYRQIPNYESYFVIEYDTVCNCSIEDFFKLDKDFFGNNIKHNVDEWEWVDRYLSFSNSTKRDFGAIGQSTCIFFKNYALKKFYTEMTDNKHLYHNMLSELRVGTVMKSLNILNKPRPDIEDFISYETWRVNPNFNQKYFYHPIKSFDIIDER